MEQIVNNLVSWFKVNKRDLPWRNNPTQYQTYVSEIMLQQTRVEAVKSYYMRFIKELPDFPSLASCSDTVLMKLWEGLGYYSRAKNMQKCAQILVNSYNEKFPKDYKQTLALPGIGSYTAGAILSRSYNLPYAAVDGNVLRVFSRLFEDDSDILKESTKKKYKELIEPYMPNNPIELNEALMELGATICMPKIAKCDMCPIAAFCRAYKNNTIFSYPKKKNKNPQKIYEYSVIFISDQTQYILFKKSGGILDGLYSPLLIDSFKTKWEIEEYIAKEYNLHVLDILPIGEDKHIFSSQIWYMRAFKAIISDCLDYEAFTEDEIKEKIGLPTAYRKFLKYLF